MRPEVKNEIGFVVRSDMTIKQVTGDIEYDAEFITPNTVKISNRKFPHINDIVQFDGDPEPGQPIVLKVIHT